jgi:DNA primase
MSENFELLSIIKNVLGDYEIKSKGNIAIYCPFCNHRKKKLEIQMVVDEKGRNPWHCWVCDKKGTTIRSLFKKVSAPKEKIDKLNAIIVPLKQDKKMSTDEFILQIPAEFKPLTNISKKNIVGRNAKYYLLSRGYTEEDILKYNIGYCDEGKYSNRVIIPSYDKDGKLNYFVARSFIQDNDRKYDNPPVSRDVVPFELFINWEAPIIICEGVFDMMSIKRNAVPLLGKTITKGLLDKLLSSKVKKIYIALDRDAMKKSLDYAQMLMENGKKVYLVDLPEKDPSDMGFEAFTSMIQKCKSLTPSELLMKKINLA